MKIIDSLKLERDKKLVSALCIWSFIHTYIIIRNNSGYESAYSQGLKLLRIDGDVKLTNPVELFYPFYAWRSLFLYSRIEMYDYTEYFVYVGGAWLVFLLYKYLRN